MSGEPLRGPIRLRRPVALPDRALDGEAILIRSPRPRLYFGTGPEQSDLPPEPLTVGLADVEGLYTELATRPQVGADGRLPGSVLPTLRTVRTWPVYSAAEMLALAEAIPGDYALRMDLPEDPTQPGVRHYVLTAAPATAPLNWVPVETPQRPVAVADVVGLQAALGGKSSGLRETISLQSGQAHPCPKVLTILGLTTASGARVRLYRTLAQLQADQARPVSDEPADGACLAEAVTTAGVLTVAPHPAVTVDTGGALWVLVEPATTVNLTYLSVEA